MLLTYFVVIGQGTIPSTSSRYATWNSKAPERPYSGCRPTRLFELTMKIHTQILDISFLIAFFKRLIFFLFF